MSHDICVHVNSIGSIDYNQRLSSVHDLYHFNNKANERHQTMMV